MSDMMEFPQTVEEFMEQYKVVDTDHIYSNGTVFVPIFRMKQWFDHVESENDHVEVVHGEWIMFERPNGGYYKGCSLCTYPMPTDMELDYLCEEDNKYCYNCGAKMDGEVKHE